MPGSPNDHVPTDDRPSRELYDEDHRRWVIRELDPPAYDVAAGTSLLFSGEGVMRRVWTYPRDWFDLPDAELYDVSLRFAPMRRRDESPQSRPDR